MKKTLLWIVGGVAGVLVLLAVVGYFAGPQPTKAKSVDQLTQLNQTLASHDLTLCEAYNWIGKMEAETRKELEDAAPGLPAAERDSMLTQVRELKWSQYSQEHQLPDSLMADINGYGLEQCK